MILINFELNLFKQMIIFINPHIPAWQKLERNLIKWKNKGLTSIKTSPD